MYERASGGSDLPEQVEVTLQTVYAQRWCLHMSSTFLHLRKQAGPREINWTTAPHY